MVGATIYEYRSGAFKSSTWGMSPDVESLSASNNNERRAEYADKNLATEEQQRISVIPDNDKELIEKIEKGTKLTAAAVTPLRKEDKPRKDKGRCTY